MKATWFRDPDNTDCPQCPYSIRIHKGDESAELTRCRNEERARALCSALNSIFLDGGDGVNRAVPALDSIFTGEPYAPDEIVGFHPLCATK